jgi:predicted dehydrogenase
MVEQATHLFDLARSLVGEAKVLASTAAAHPRPIYPDADVADVSAALLTFKGGIPGVFSATCLAGGQSAVYVQIICEGLLITITQSGATYDIGMEKRKLRLGNDPFLDEDRLFIKAVQRNDPSLLLSNYEDALKTHRLCHDVLEMSQKS